MRKIYETRVVYQGAKGLVVRRSFNGGERVSYRAFTLVDDREFPDKGSAVGYLDSVFRLVCESAD